MTLRLHELKTCGEHNDELVYYIILIPTFRYNNDIYYIRIYV